MQTFVPVLEWNFTVKNAPKLSAKDSQVKICKIKQMQNIPVILRTFLNQIKTLKILTLKMTPRTLTHLKFQVKLVTEKSFKLTIQIFHV